MLMNTAMMMFLSAVTGASAIQILSSAQPKKPRSKTFSIPNMKGLIRFGSNKSSSSSPSQAFTVPQGFNIKALGAGITQDANGGIQIESQTDKPFLQKGDEVVLDFDEEANEGEFKGCDGLKGTIKQQHPKSVGVTDEDHPYFDKWHVRVVVDPNKIHAACGGSKAVLKTVDGKPTALTSMNGYRFKKVMAVFEDEAKESTTIFQKADGIFVIEGEVAESFVPSSQILEV